MRDSDNSIGKELAKALLQAQKAILSVGKTSRNEFAKYDYTSSESMLAECRAVLADNGVLLSCAPGTRHVEEIAESTGTDWLIATCKYVVVHVESGEQAEYVYQLPALTGKGRPLDKAVLGAWTTTLGYFLRDLLMIPRVDENEIDNRNDATLSPKVIGERAIKMVKDFEEAGLPLSDLLDKIRRRYPDASDDPREWLAAWETGLATTLRQLKDSAD